MALLDTKLRKPGPLTSPVKQFGKPKTRFLKIRPSGNVVLRRKLAEARELLRNFSCQKCTIGRRIELHGNFVFSTHEVLETARRAEKG
jgi:hypothetical protein